MTGAACAGRRIGFADRFDAETAAREVADALRGLGVPERAAQEKRYLNSDLEFFGVTVPETRRGVTFREASRRLPADEAGRLRGLR